MRQEDLVKTDMCTSLSDLMSAMILEVNWCSLFLLRVRRACRPCRGPNQPSSQPPDPSPRWLSPSPKAWALLPSPLPPRLFQPRLSTASRERPRWASSFQPCSSGWMCSFSSFLSDDPIFGTTKEHQVINIYINEGVYYSCTAWDHFKVSQHNQNLYIRRTGL